MDKPASRSPMTSRDVKIFFHHAPRKPNGGAPHYANALLEDTFHELGWSVDSHYAEEEISWPDLFFPLREMRRIAGIEAAAADLAFYCDGGTLLRPPSRRIARRSAVFFHGVGRGSAVWAANPEVDLYIANSAYLQRLLQSVMSLPDWRRRHCLDPRVFYNTARLTLALPCVESPDGHPAVGAGRQPVLPGPVRAAIEAGGMLGHAIQPGKPDLVAQTEILVALNALARASGDGRPVRLLVSERDAARYQQAVRPAARETLARLGLTPEDLFLGVPPLPQATLFELVAACGFCLCYNVVPEPFGFYVLESVFHLCPVYTNGAGNMRFMPEGHGIESRETLEMAFERTGFEAVASRILHDAGPGREEAERRCRLGRDLVARSFTRDVMRRELASCLERLEEGDRGEPVFDALVFGVGPGVRLWDRESGRVISDLHNVQLTREENELAASLVGGCAGESRGFSEDRLAILDRLFDAGVLTLETAGP
jgi:hypothetical protein